MGNTGQRIKLTLVEKAAAGQAVELDKKNRLGLTPPKRINVANKLVADELLVSQNLMFLQQDDYYKAQEHIQLLSGEVDSLKGVIKKKQDLINRLQQGITDRDYKIEELQKQVAGTHVERSAFKVLEDQNASLIMKVTTTGQKLEETNKDLRAKIEEQHDVRTYSDAKVRDAIKTEVMLQSTIQQITFNLANAEKTKAEALDMQESLQRKMVDLQNHLQLVSETSKEQLYRSRQTEYKSLRRLDEMTERFTVERDEKNLMRDTVKLASMRGDVLANRLGDALEKTEGQQLMVQSIVRQVENSNDALRAREKALEKQNMHLTAQLRLSQMAVADMLRRYKVSEKAQEDLKIEAYTLKQALKPKRKGETRDESGGGDAKGKPKKPPGMAGSTTANANKLFMKNLAAATTQSVTQIFPQDRQLATSITQSILSTEEGEGEEDGKVGSSVSRGGGGGDNNNDADSAMRDYNSFIYEDTHSVGSASTFRSGSMGGLSAGNAIYEHDDDEFGQPGTGFSSAAPSPKFGKSAVGNGNGSRNQQGMYGLGNDSLGGNSNFSTPAASLGNLSGGASVFGVPAGTGTGGVSFAFTGGAGPGASAGAKAGPLPTLIADQEAQAVGKANLLSAYLRLAISSQNAGATAGLTAASLPRLGVGLGATSTSTGSLQVIDLVRCELIDNDMKQVMDLLRLLSLKDIHRIDLRRNHFSPKAVDVLSAFIVGIAGTDLLQRSAPLEIDLRYNHLNTQAVERLAGKLRQTPRSEIKLIKVEEEGQTILMYGTNKLVVRIDCRDNDDKKTKLSLKERLTLGNNMTSGLEVAYPGDDLAARNPNYYEGTVYPRDQILNYNPI